MKQTIRYKLLTVGCAPVLNDNGDAYDLCASEAVSIKGPVSAIDPEGSDIKMYFSHAIIPLGIAMELPKGFVADLKPRSSTYKKWHILQTNTPGLIDSSYCGDTDEWGMTVVALGTSHIRKGDRICQFEIRPSQKATLWQKIKWLFTTGYNFVAVDSLENEARGGFGEGTKSVDETLC